MESGFLEDVEQHAVAVSGGTCDLPIIYRDVFSIAGAFTAPALKLRELLPTSRLVPAELLPGKGLLLFMAADCRDTSIGPHRQFAIMVPARYQPRYNPPLLPLLRMSASLSFEVFVWRFLLTSELGMRAGSEIWGLPASLADIDFEESAQAVTCRLREKGEEVLSLEVKKSPARMKTYFDCAFFSPQGRALLRTRADGISGSLGRGFRPGGARLTLGDNDLSHRIREIAPGRSVMTMYVPRGRMLLPEAEERLPL